MAEQSGAPRPNVSDMYAVHGVFRDVLGAAPILVGGIEPGDTDRTALIANYYENILSFLEAHHDGEEKLVFPLLRERCTGGDALVERMTEEHRQAMVLLEEAKNMLEAWPAGDATTQKAALDALALFGVTPGPGVTFPDPNYKWTDLIFSMNSTDITIESLTSIVRAGAGIILTYFSKPAARLLA